MKFTLSWLKDHLETSASLDAILEGLTMTGTEVEGVVDPASKLAAFSVAHILEAEKHPNADKLQVCKVATKDGEKRIVCGAPNARAGLVTIYAPIGAYVPGLNVTLDKRAVRGVESEGMLCSAAELQLGGESDGILDLSGDLKVGASAAEALGVGDPVIDVEITPNRPDCLGVAGIARDLAAAGLGKRTTKPVQKIPGKFPCPIEIKLDAPDACPIFAGRLIRGVKNGPSPLWLQRRLEAVGLRPISALVDVTNLLSLDRARPLHVFDAAKLNGAIHARLAKEDETLLALDGKTYTLKPSMCVIADHKSALGLGGVMGGEASGCTETTTDVFIESAYFDPARTRETGRLTGIVSDARYRFERGVDTGFVVDGLELATQLIMDMCGGEPSEILVAGEAPKAPGAIDFPLKEIARLTGIQMNAARATEILQSLGFKVEPKGKDALTVTPPTFRRDISGKADLVEEIARIHGFDNMPAISLTRPAGRPKPILTPLQVRGRIARRGLAGLGYLEAVTWSFLPRAQSEAFGGGDARLVLDNPIAADLNTMRPSVIANLLTAAQKNADRGNSPAQLFELGPVYLGDGPNDQRTSIGAVRVGVPARHWRTKAAAPDLYDIKADLAALLDGLGQPMNRFQFAAPDRPWLHPGRGASLRLGPKNVIAVFGEVHPGVLKTIGVDGPAVAFELYLEDIPAQKGKSGKTKPALDASDLMPLTRDFAFLLSAEKSAIDLVRAIEGSDKDYIASVAVFDVYQGQGVPEGQKSIAVEVRIQPKDKTLSDSDIEAISRKIVAAASKSAGAFLRG